MKTNAPPIDNPEVEVKVTLTALEHEIISFASLRYQTTIEALLKKSVRSLIEGISLSGVKLPPHLTKTKK
jgi:hypothetical protein